MIEVTVDTRAIDRVLRDLQHAGQRLEPVFKNIGEHLMVSTGQRFRDSEAPDGTPWKDNSAVTLARKSGSRPLIGGDEGGAGGALRDQNHYNADDRQVEFGNSQVYAAMQQFGGSKTQFPHLWADIPARPFIGLSDADEDEIAELALDHLRNAAMR